MSSSFEMEIIMRTDDFQKNFWSWFDSLSIKEKERFWYYRSEVSELYFYNAIYKKGY